MMLWRGQLIKQIKVAMLARNRKPKHFFGPAAEQPSYDPGGLEAGDNVIDEGQIIGSNHDQGLYLAGLNW